MPTLELSSRKLDYQVTYSKKRKTIGIAVDRVNGLSVSVPEGTPLNEINHVLLKKQDWIVQKIQEFSEILPPPPPKEFVSGERLPYIGRSYRLRVERRETDTIEFKFSHGKFIVSIPSREKHDIEKIRREVIRWYKNRALEKIQSRVEFYAPKVGEWPIGIRVKDFRARWGTCQADGSIDFNWRIIMAPMSIIDYVVVHELCHLVAKNHSKVFWSRLSAILVDHEKRREWLRINGTQLTI